MEYDDLDEYEHPGKRRDIDDNLEYGKRGDKEDAS